MLKEIIAHRKPKSPISEAYRMLRTNISFSSIDKELKSIIITSASPSEGKSTTIANLAMTMVQAGKRVLIIDTDLRKPKVHKNFELPNMTGVTNVIAEHRDYRECIQAVGVDNLDILTAGPIPPNPSELLGSKKMDEFISVVTGDYDVVLFDAPPVGSVTDAAILSTKVDGVILVISSGATDIKIAQRAKELLEKVSANILGVVLNKISKQTAGNYYYYYYSYYENGDEAKNKKRSKNRKR